MKVRSKILKMLLVGALAAASLNVVVGGGAQAANVAASDPLPSLVRIVNFGSNKCAEVNQFGDPSVNGERVVQRTCDSSPEQIWATVRVNLSGNDYRFVNRVSGKCLDVKDGTNADRTPIQQWDCRGGPSMTWRINPGSFSGVHQVISRTGSRCLDVANGSVDDGAQIQIYRCSGFGNAAQVWSFTAAA